MYYLNLFLELEKLLQAEQWTILVVEDITWDRRTWVTKSHDAFKAAKIVPRTIRRNRMKHGLSIALAALTLPVRRTP